MSNFTFKKPDAYKNVNTTSLSTEPVQKNKKFFSCSDMMDETPMEVTSNINYSKFHYLSSDMKTVYEDQKPNEYKSINSSSYQNLSNYVDNDLADKVVDMEI